MAQAIGAKLYLTVATCAALLLASGCSAPEPEAETTTTTVVQMSDEQLQSVLGDFAQNHEGAKVITDQQLRTSIPRAQEWIENAQVNPSKCGVTFAEPIAEQLKAATMAAIELPDSFVTVAIYKDQQVLQKQWDAKTAANADCSRYTVKSDNATRAYHLAKQPLEAMTELSDGYVVTSSNGSSTQQQLVIRSATSNILLGYQRPTSAAKTTDGVKEATQILHELMDKLK